MPPRPYSFKVMSYKIDKEKCISCGACVAACPKGFKMEEDNKAKVINQEEAKKCQPEDLCAVDAIEKSK